MRARVLGVALALAAAGCSAAFHETAPPPHVVTHVRVAGARLAVTWVGHATMLVQMDDRYVLTDPVFTTLIGGFSRRKVGVPLDPKSLPPLDAVLVSHVHFDHLSLGSLAAIEPKVRRLYMPEGGLEYLTDFSFDAVDLARFETVDDRGLRITAVPVHHVGGRYGLDSTWSHAFTGYVVQYHGMTVYFAGDTAYSSSDFAATRRRFGHIDLALLPIAPMHPRTIMHALHMDPDEALDAFRDLGAARMIPMHFDTFVDSLDEPHEARDRLQGLVASRDLGDRVSVLEIGQQAIIIPR